MKDDKIGQDLAFNIFDYIHEVEMDDLLKVGKSHPEIMNVIVGVADRASALYFVEDSDDFHLLFVGEKNGAKCFSLVFNFGQETHFYYILLFCSFIGGEFPYVNPIHLHNGFIHLLRTWFESNGMPTVTATDKKLYREKFGSGVFIGAIYLRDLNEIDFYRELFSFDINGFFPNNGASYVYLMYHEGNGYFKIGKSKNPLKRERTLQAEQPNIALLKVWDAGGSFEKKLHARYSKLRKRGEWFALTFRELFDLRDLKIDSI